VSWSGRPLVLATRSEGKLRELRPLFADAGIPVMELGAAGIEPSAEEDAVEAFATFEENALAKARYFQRRSGGSAVVADDSGLEVDALGGAPGVRSKRWSGRTDLEGQVLDDANNAKLLSALAGSRDRGARYVCVAAFTDGDREIACRGETSGLIALEPSGTGGFGYDPYFFSSELGRTFGEASRAEKEVVSHRGRAFRALVAAIRGR
jgi:XTP/dITP diphosphohydrolase